MLRTLTQTYMQDALEGLQMRLDGKLMAIKVKCYVLYEEVRGRRKVFGIHFRNKNGLLVSTCW